MHEMTWKCTYGVRYAKYTTNEAKHFPKEVTSKFPKVWYSLESKWVRKRLRGISSNTYCAHYKQCMNMEKKNP